MVETKRILKDLFDHFPELQEVWVNGDLEHFSNAELIVDDNVDYGDVMKYLFDKYELYDKELALHVFQKSLCTEIEIEFTHYIREDVMFKTDENSILEDLFNHFTDLQELWYTGDLSNRAKVCFIVDDNVDYGDVWDYIDERYAFSEDDICVFQKRIFGDVKSNYKHCIRGDFNGY